MAPCDDDGSVKSQCHGNPFCCERTLHITQTTSNDDLWLLTPRSVLSVLESVLPFISGTQDEAAYTACCTGVTCPNSLPKQRTCSNCCSSGKEHAKTRNIVVSPTPTLPIVSTLPASSSEPDDILDHARAFLRRMIR